MPSRPPVRCSLAGPMAPPKLRDAQVEMIRVHCHQPAKDYVARRTAEGKTKTEILRCLKRYIARETYPYLTAIIPDSRQPAGPRPLALTPRR
jgi:hypothetical protein